MPPDAYDAYEVWQSAVWDAWEAAGHYEKACDGWQDDPDGNVICTTCLEAVPVPQEAATA